MANMNVKKRLESIDAELRAVLFHVKQHSGVDARQAVLVDNAATCIVESAAAIAEVAREAQGIRERPGSLVRKIRKALGFTRP